MAHAATAAPRITARATREPTIVVSSWTALRDALVRRSVAGRGRAKHRHRRSSGRCSDRRSAPSFWRPLTDALRRYPTAVPRDSGSSADSGRKPTTQRASSWMTSASAARLRPISAAAACVADPFEDGAALEARRGHRRLPPWRVQRAGPRNRPGGWRHPALAMYGSLTRGGRPPRHPRGRRAPRTAVRRRRARAGTSGRGCRDLGPVAVADGAQAVDLEGRRVGARRSIPVTFERRLGHRTRPPCRACRRARRRPPGRRPIRSWPACPAQLRCGWRLVRRRGGSHSGRQSRAAR